MRSRIIISMIVVSLGLMAGCGAAAKMITAKSQSERMDVFTEVADAAARPQGFADMIVKANIKTHEADLLYLRVGKKPAWEAGLSFCAQHRRTG